MTTVVEVSGGKARGVEIDDGVLAWRGIPYAAAPVGPLRLRLPQPVEPWGGVRDASRFGARAVQPDVPPVAGLPASAEQPPTSEDCLFVNVTAPAGSRGRPVLVWIHGGGYCVGSGPDLAEDGLSFVRSHGFVVVTFNYRLGALGFLAVDGEEHTGAYGLHDQIALLRWVRDNIAAFGGDPGRVTVYGVSAGAKSVANLMAAPPARGLFHQAASSSGGEHVATREQSGAVARRFLRELGADAGRLRDVPARDVLRAQLAISDVMRSTWLWRPAVDGLALRRRPVEAVAAGSAAGVRLLAQHCVNECGVFQLMDSGAAGHADRVLAEAFGEAGRDEILAAYAAYAADEGASPARLRLDVMTDERYAIPTTRLADAQAAHGPVWRSRYDGPVSGMAAFHGTDATAVWAGGAGVAGRLHEIWGSFVAGGPPNAEGLPDWPEYGTDRRSTLVIAASGARVEDDPRAARRAAWDGRDWQPGVWYPLGLG